MAGDFAFGWQDSIAAVLLGAWGKLDAFRASYSCDGKDVGLGQYRISLQ